MVAGGPCLPGRIPVGQVLELGVEHHRLQRVEARVESQLRVMVLDVTAVVAKCPTTLRHTIVLGCHGPGIPKGPQILAGVEAKRGGRTPVTHRRPCLTCAVGLGGVFDDRQIVPFGNRGDRSHRRGLPVKVNGQQRLGAWRQGILDRPLAL